MGLIVLLGNVAFAVVDDAPVTVGVLTTVGMSVAVCETDTVTGSVMTETATLRTLVVLTRSVCVDEGTGEEQSGGKASSKLVAQEL